MFKIVSSILLCLVLFSFEIESFKEQQLKYARYRNAYAKHEKEISALIKEKGCRLYLRAFKQNKKLEVWLCNLQYENCQLVKTFDFCALSGDIGPKIKKGDGQTPEGFYHIDRFNPVSNFYLSLGLNYPNKADKIRSGKLNPGGDIFIHGNCVTIGCIPIKDEGIEWLYALCVEIKSIGQNKIPVHIFPFFNMDTEISSFSIPHLYTAFWNTLLPAYKNFEKQRKVPTFEIDSNGNYIIN
ncbi:MAG: murein L,D-transpeptidase family protein [Bacteroidia bacterium]